MKHHVSNKDDSVRMFKSDLLEFFSHVHPATPHIIYVPVVAYTMYLTSTTGVDFFIAVALIFLGLLVWSFTEYTLHRFVFHFPAKGALGKKIHFMIHGVHHDYPNDATRLVMPPIVSVPLAIIFYLFFKAVIGAYYLPPFFGGFLIGYLFYDTTHYAVHHLRLHGKIGLYLKQHHMRHHYMSAEQNFGVSSPLWDFVFGTFLPKPTHETVPVNR